MVKKYRFDLPEETKPESAKQVSLFDLDLGKVWVRVRHRLRGDSRFEIATATAVAGVRGTIFSVEADADGTAIEVFDGQVTVAAGDDTAAIGPRMAAQATAQDLAVRPLSLAEQEAWADRDVLLPGVRFRRFLPARVQADGTYRLRGDTEPGATVTVDDQPVTVEPDGSFETTVRVQPGVNTWRVRVEDAAGHRRDTEYIIDHRPTTS